MKKSYFIQTYGCQMNVADSELIEKILIDKDYQKSNEPQNADAIVEVASATILFNRK